MALASISHCMNESIQLEIDDLNERLFLKGRGKLSMAIKHVQPRCLLFAQDNAFNANPHHRRECPLCAALRMTTL